MILHDDRYIRCSRVSDLDMCKLSVTREFGGLTTSRTDLWVVGLIIAVRKTGSIGLKFNCALAQCWLVKGRFIPRYNRPPFSNTGGWELARWAPLR